MTRSTARDGWLNQLQFHVLTNYEPVWEFLQRRPVLRRAANRALINSAITYIPTRPNPLSTLAPYTSWSSLTDRRYDARHLPPAPQDGLPPAEAVADLFVRRGEDKLCPKSTVMFAYFAEWFTDGFLRSDRRPERDPKRNDTNHEIDLTPLYGVRPEQTDQLREHTGGRLKSQQLNGGEFPPYLCGGRFARRVDFCRDGLYGDRCVSVSRELRHLLHERKQRGNPRLIRSDCNAVAFRVTFAAGMVYYCVENA
jgi:prostaglandin-endoperoxide synthase 2